MDSRSAVDAATAAQADRTAKLTADAAPVEATAAAAAEQSAAEKKRIKNRKKKERQRRAKAQAAAAGGSQAQGPAAFSGKESTIADEDDEEDDDGTFDFGESVSLTARIRHILGSYPDGTTILKELVQNVSLPH
jgi:hypothetical protein